MNLLKLILCAIPIMFSCASTFKNQSENGGNEVRYIVTDSATNAFAYDKILKVFENNSKEISLFDSVVGCLPFLWSELKENPYFEKADGPTMWIDMGNNPGGDKKVFVGKALRKKPVLDSLQSFLINSVKNDSSFIVRKLNKNELQIYWAFISFDIEEPIYILINKHRKLILHFNKYFVFQIDDISETHKIEPVSFDSIMKQLPNLNNKSK